MRWGRPTRGYGFPKAWPWAWSLSSSWPHWRPGCSRARPGWVLFRSSAHDAEGIAQIIDQHSSPKRLLQRSRRVSLITDQRAHRRGVVGIGIADHGHDDCRVGLREPDGISNPARAVL